MQMIRFNGNNLSEIMDFIMQPVFSEKTFEKAESPEIQLTTASGTLTARVGDWILREGDDFQVIRKDSPELNEIAPIQEPVPTPQEKVS